MAKLNSRQGRRTKKDTYEMPHNEKIILVPNEAALGLRQGKLFSYALLASLFAYPFSSYLSEFLGLQSNLLSIAARAVTLIIVLGYLFFLIVNRLFRPIPIFYLFLVFWVFYLFRIFHDTIQYGHLLGKTPAEYYLFALVLSFFCSFPFFVPVTIPFKFIEKVSWVFLVVLNVLGVYNILAADNLFMERLGGNERMNPILFGMIAALLSGFSIVRVLRPGSSIIFKFVNIFSTFLGLINLIASASKSPVLFLIITLLALIIFHYKAGNKKSLVILMVILGGSIGAVFVYGLQDMLLLVITRFTDIADDTSSVERWDMLSGGFIQFLKEPLLGSFLEERISREYPHNLVVESFMATGLVGGTLFVVYYVTTIRSMAGVLFRTGLSFISLTSLSVIILSLFSGGLSFSVDFWFNSAVINAIFFCYQKPNNAIQPSYQEDFSLV